MRRRYRRQFDIPYTVYYRRPNPVVAAITWVLDLAIDLAFLAALVFFVYVMAEKVQGLL
jgi:hypothetical protein